MSSKHDFRVIIKHTDMNDPDELRDVLAMLGEEADKHQQEINRLKKAVERINAQYPSTAERKP